MLASLLEWFQANWSFIVETFIKASIIGGVIQGAVAYIVYAERRTASFIQERIGPNRCGPLGLLQPIADGVKLMFKEDILPNHVNKVFFILAPVLALMPALATMAVIPFGGDVVLEGGRVIQLQAADVNVGALYVFALASLGVYGLALGGWASNSKYSLLGGIRSSAQMISYELPLTLCFLTAIIATGTLDLNEIVMQQGPWPWQWHLFGFGTGTARLISIVPLFLATIIFVISIFAETNRLPFDMPEAESELVSGYHTEFSSMKFGLFFLAEYANMLTGCAMTASLFFGGWLFPGWGHPFFESHPILFGLCGLASFVLKVGFFMFIMMWVRWTLPRFRYDQLMALGWKRLLPLSLACVIGAACAGVFVAN
ncbi:MAG: NADH-quinone oxidoreductase subunit NuoH [Acidobacteriota bacterium]